MSENSSVWTSPRNAYYPSAEQVRVIKEILSRRGPKGASRVLGICERTLIRIAAGIGTNRKTIGRIESALSHYRRPGDPDDDSPWSHELPRMRAAAPEDSHTPSWESALHRKSREEIMFPEDYE